MEIEMLNNYSVACINKELHAFPKAGAEGRFELISFDPEKAVKNLEKKKKATGEVYRAFGVYLINGALNNRERWPWGYKDGLILGLKYLKKALNMGCKSYIISGMQELHA